MSVRLRPLPTARILASPLVTVGLAAVSILLTVSLGRAFATQFTLSQSVRRVRLEIAQLSAQQASLSTLVARFQSPQALESDARLRLNLAKPGEVLAVLPDPAPATRSGSTTSPSIRSIPSRWFSYFFEPR